MSLAAQVVGSILKHDRKVNSYKLALIRSINVSRWGRMHAVRSVLSLASLLTFLLLLVKRLR